MLLLIKKHTDTLIEQTKTKSQETLEFKMNKHMQTFSFKPPDLVYRMRLSYDEIMDKLDLKNNPTKRTGYSLDPGIYEVIDLDNTLKHILTDKVKVNVTIDDIRLKAIIKTNQTLNFTEKSFFYTILGFTRS